MEINLNITEDEFTELFLKNLFKEFIEHAKGKFADGELEKMRTILTTIFVKEFSSGKTPSQIIREHKDIEEWLDDEIVKFKN